MKTPKQLVKLFIGTTLFIFLTVVFSVYLFSNTFLKYYLFRELEGLFPGELKIGYLSSDLISNVTIKNVSLAPGVSQSLRASINTAEVSVASIRLDGSIINAAFSKPSFDLNFSSLDLTIKSDGEELCFPDGLGLKGMNFTSGGHFPLDFFNSIIFDSCNIKFVLCEKGFAREVRAVNLRNFSGRLRPENSSAKRFNIVSSFDYLDDFLKLEKISYQGVLDTEKMFLSGNALINEGMVSNLNSISGDYIKFNGIYSCNYDFTLFLSKLNQKSSEYLIGNADFKISSAEVAFKTPVIGETVLTGINGIVALNSGKLNLTFKDFSGKYCGSAVAITGEVDLSTRRMDVLFSGKGIKLPPEKFDSAEAEINGKVVLSGTVLEPVFSVNLTSPVIHYKNTQFADAQFSIVVDSRSVELNDLRAACFGGEISAFSKLELPSEQISGALKVKNLKTAAIRKFHDFELSAVRDFEIKKGAFAFSGKLHDANSYNVSGTTEISDCRVLSDGIIVNGINFRMRNGEIAFPSIKLVTEGTEHKNEISGKYNVQTGRYDFSGKNLVFNVSNISELKKFQSRASGLAAFSFELEGGRGSQKVEFLANIEQLKIGGALSGVEKVRGVIVKKGSGFEFTNFRIDNNIVLNSGTIDRESNFNLSFNLYEVSVSQLKKFVNLEVFSKLAGKISGGIVLNGNLNHLENIKTTVEIKDLAVKYETLNIKNTSAIKIKNQKTRLEFDSFHISVNEHSLSVAGFIDFLGSGEVGLKVKLDDTDLNVLKLYTKNVFREISGNIDMEGVIKGEIRNPKFDGFANISAKTIKINGINETISGLDLQFESKNYAVKVKKGTLKVENSVWEVGGGATINQGGAPLYLDLTIECKDLKHEVGKNSSFEGNAKLGIKGDAAKPRLYGSFKITKGKIELSPELFKAKREPLSVGPLELDVIIFADKNVWLANSFVNAEIKGKFTLKSSKNNLVYTGVMNTVRGNAIFNNKEFKITEGKLQFNDNPMFDPLFTIKGETKIDVFKIELNVSGSTSNPLFNLSSQPPLTQPEITALLTTGHVQSSINSKDAASMPAKMYADYQKEQVLGGVKNKVKDALNLDELSVKTGGTTEKGGQIEQSVSVGKYVNDKLFVNYTENKEKDVDKKVKHYQFNYKVNQNLDLDVKESNTEGSSVGLKVKKNF